MSGLIRKMEIDDVESVSIISVASFKQAVSSQLSDEGIRTFLEISSPESFLARMKQDNLMLIFEDADGISGIVELKEGRHIAMLFISPEKQRMGIGRKLIEKSLKYSRVEVVTVNASLVSVAAYEKYGFAIVGQEEETNGLRYQPMEIDLRA